MRLLHAAELLIFYVYEVLVSNLRVAHDVLTPTHHMRPELILLNIEGLTDRQLLAASNLITMTPGTLSLDVTPDGKFLQIHCMYAEDAEAEVRKMETSYLRRIRKVF